MSTRRLQLISFLLFVGVVGTLAIWSWQTSNSHEPQNERYTVNTLRRFILPAQREFRETDPLGNGKREYWHADVAGLYFLKGADGKPIHLISQSTAAADDRPVTKFEDGVTPGTSGGYWYRSLGGSDPGRFAVCAHPGSLMGGRWIYLITEADVLWRREASGAKPPDRLPADPEKDGWERRSASDRY